MARNNRNKKKKYQELLSDSVLTVHDMIDNLGASVFRWSGLDPIWSPPSEMFELMLLKYNNMTAFDTNIGLQILPSITTRLNQWGLPAEGSAQPIAFGAGVISIQPKADGNLPMILYDQPSHRSIMPNLMWYTDALGKLRRAIDSCTMWLKTPILFIGSEAQEELIYNLLRRIEMGESAIAIYEGSIDLNGMVLTPTNVTPSILAALHDSYNRIKGMLFAELGVPDYNDVKMAQQTKTEVILPMLEVALKTMNRLQMRRLWADKVNQVYGTDISVQALSLGLIEQSIFSSTGHAINLQDLNNNGIPDILEGGRTNGTT